MNSEVLRFWLLEEEHTIVQIIIDICQILHFRNTVTDNNQLMKYSLSKSDLELQYHLEIILYEMNIILKVINVEIWIERIYQFRHVDVFIGKP